VRESRAAIAADPGLSVTLVAFGADMRRIYEEALA